MLTTCPQPVAILWDIANCAIPKDVNAVDVAMHIRLALKVQLAIPGPIIMFSAYGNSLHLPQHTRQDCHKTGVSLIDIPHGRKDAVHNAILVDMFLFALDNPPPCTLVLIAGDVDYAPALHRLGQRGYCVVLAVPLSPNMSPALCNACKYVCSWPDVARGRVLNLVKSRSLCMIEDCKPLDMAVQDSKLSHQVVSNVKNNSIDFAKGKGQNDKPPKVIAPNAKNDCIDVAKGKIYSKSDFIDRMEGGGLSPNQHGTKNSRTIPVGLFEESVKLPFGFAKESSEIAVVTSNSTSGYAKIHPLTAQRLNGGVASRKFTPPNGQYVCDWFALPQPEKAHMLKKEGFDVHQTKAEFEHHISHAHDNEGVANVSSHKLANKPAEYALHDVRVCENHNPIVPSYPTDPVVQGHISRSHKAQMVNTNSKHVTQAWKQVAHVKSQGTPSQLKVKKQKMKKTKEHCVVETASVAAPKKKKKKTKEYSVIEAAPVVTSKFSKKQRQAARLAALQQ